MRSALIVASLFIGILVSRAQPTGRQVSLPPDAVPSGPVLYQQACATCHGDDGKGHGPAVVHLQNPPPDLTTLTKRHGGKFPYDYVSTVLLTGVKLPAHGTPDMPVWGPVFKFVDKDNRQAVLRRIENLSNYLASMQQK